MSPTVRFFSVVLRGAPLALATQGLAAVDGPHYRANNCELFIDKVTAYHGSHGLYAEAVYVKVLKNRLDGELKEVGFRGRAVNATPRAPWPTTWRDYPLWSASPVGDYWQLPVYLGSDYGHSDYEGAFYVRTSKGTTFWFKPKSGGNPNFVFDRRSFNDVFRMSGLRYNYDSRPVAGVPSQRPDMAYFNPDRCY